MEAGRGWRGNSAAALLIARSFAAGRHAIAALEAGISSIEQRLDETREQQSGEERLLAEVVEGEGEKQKITAKTVKVRLKDIGRPTVLFLQGGAAVA